MLDEDDQWHSDASKAFELLKSQQRKTLATEFVLLECGNAAAQRPYRIEIDDLRKRLQARFALLEVTANDLGLAWQAYRQEEAASAGIVDQVSFVVMRRMGLTDAFTNDRHFTAAGFTNLF